MSVEVVASSTILRTIKSEFFLWVIAACIISGRFLVSLSFYGLSPKALLEAVNFYYFDILIGVTIMVFPLLFLQIFGVMPFEALRNRKTNSKKEAVHIRGNGNVINIVDKATGSEEFSTKDYLYQLVKEADILSRKIYNRSGVYLLFGVLIAFSGIVYFSISPINIPNGASLTESFLILAPRFGILFFIEFIAFFFLKQYRSAMDEFRHYDSLKRNRESQLAILLMATDNFIEKSFVTVANEMSFFNKQGVLAQGETTELLEASKLNNSEIEVLKVLVQDTVKVASAK
ncbi:hypothetical protein [Aeromonas dhakensis]|uniref:hypothetical protein n=1 Tax=Aeromonas dhakensis TaxID=196024 RepID=UPI001AAFDF27|nr:hypothetical protein [Aeromonas dhakensis]MBO2903384.1 hypothetical protein [Aeromonas dhakensis]MBO2997947.1 hypothetical protein [Aeromonas dhakensis]